MYDPDTFAALLPENTSDLYNNRITKKANHILQPHIYLWTVSIVLNYSILQAMILQTLKLSTYLGDKQQFSFIILLWFPLEFFFMLPFILHSWRLEVMLQMYRDRTYALLSYCFFSVLLCKWMDQFLTPLHLSCSLHFMIDRMLIHGWHGHWRAISQ
jgi:hypothetical protein